jgi:hypothetical protein
LVTLKVIVPAATSLWSISIAHSLSTALIVVAVLLLPVSPAAAVGVGSAVGAGSLPPAVLLVAVGSSMGMLSMLSSITVEVASGCTSTAAAVVGVAAGAGVLVAASLPQAARTSTASRAINPLIIIAFILFAAFLFVLFKVTLYILSESFIGICGVYASS